MILPGHLSAGYLVAKAVLAVHPEISVSEVGKLTLLGTFSGLAPDLDLIYYFFKIRSFRFQPDSTHRYYITHTPFFWILAGVLIFFITGNNVAALIVSLAALSHIFFDSFDSGHGLMWFWPFSTKKFLFLNPIENNPKADSLSRYYFLLIKEYTKHVTFYLEVIITIFALLIFLK